MKSFFENIKCKTKFTLPSDKNIVWYVLLIYSIIFAGQSLFTNFASKRGQLWNVLRKPISIMFKNKFTYYYRIKLSRNYGKIIS